jgi:hypothetical protein
MILKDKWYDTLKWTGLIALPALAVFYNVVGEAWGLPYVDEIVTTLNAIGVLIGTLIGVSNANYYKKNE